MTRAHLKGALVEMGWSGADLKADLADFQRGWNLGPALTIDGVNGPLTREAVRLSIRMHRAGQPDASLSFSFAEFGCHCPGYAGCRRIRVHRALIRALEAYRKATGNRAVRVISGYRCTTHNRRVGGATSSQHLHGAAADIDYRLSWRDVARLRLAGGIGRSKRTGLVRHIDVRHLSGHNLTGATPDRPTIWDYAA